MKWWLLTLLFLFSATPVSAISVAISTPSASIDQDQELSLDVFLSCNNCGDSYLRGVFFETGDNYFGLTQNNSEEWVGTSSDRTKYFKVSKDEVKDTWSGKLRLKVDTDSSFYKGPGNYSLKVGRYTASSGSSATWSESYYLNITGPTPTPTPTSLPTSTPTPTPTPTRTPTPTPAPVITKLLTPTTKLVLASFTPTATASFEVLGEGITATGEAAVKEETKKSWKPLIISLLFVGLGLALAAGVLVWKKSLTPKSLPPKSE